MENPSTQIKIGIIGSDSSHTLAFAKKMLQDETCIVSWIDIQNYTNLSFSHTRSPGIIESLQTLGIPLVNGYENQMPVDAYCILTLDASNHRSIMKTLKLTGKPIFIDKPIFNDLDDFKDLEGVRYFSTSALRYCGFVQQAHKQLPSNITEIKIEGPLSYLDEVDGYLWYGIHLIEMVSVLSQGQMKLVSKTDHGDYELVILRSDRIEFTVKAIKVGDPEFVIEYGDKRYSITDDTNAIYDNLIEVIIDFFKGGKYSSDEYNVIQTVLEINKMNERNPYET